MSGGLDSRHHLVGRETHIYVRPLEQPQLRTGPLRDRMGQVPASRSPTGITTMGAGEAPASTKTWSAPAGQGITSGRLRRATISSCSCSADAMAATTSSAEKPTSTSGRSKSHSLAHRFAS